MKKLIIFIMAVISLTACKKENAAKGGSFCWHCTYGPVAGVNYAPTDTCTSNDTQPVGNHYGNTNSQGDIITGQCTRQ